MGLRFKHGIQIYQGIHIHAYKSLLIDDDFLPDSELSQGFSALIAEEAFRHPWPGHFTFCLKSHLGLRREKTTV